MPKWLDDLKAKIGAVGAETSPESPPDTGGGLKAFWDAQTAKMGDWGDRFSSMQTWPDWKDPDTLKRMAGTGAAAFSVPALLAFLIGTARSRAQDKAFESDVREIVEAEHPVMSLDPNLDDEKEESKLARMGVHKLAFGEAATDVPAVPNVPAGGFKSRMEPGILIALAYLASLAGVGAGAAWSGKHEAKRQDKRYKRKLNELEKAEYERLYQLHSPDAYAATVPKLAVSEASVLDACIALHEGGPYLKRSSDILKQVVHVAEEGEDGYEVEFNPGFLEKIYLKAVGSPLGLPLDAFDAA